MDSIKLSNYEKGLLIVAITRAVTAGNDFSRDDIEKLNTIKKRLQKPQEKE